ncbi:hypothetical protein QRX60_07840 [Amycolatopsis mongoliensis]|uniref:Uncharacterized protein n=1 Tax=Amycolatopsis mongoliensis TaxID=715475 RepID=A0A9Y2JVK1_9PSEU|nr:hypothetical protein [Amycolatopsis sp. 4-36]WIY03754.1 hypothetical protein QRX60_07840 [Amycolatopsis sp. 4-36]
MDRPSQEPPERPGPPSEAAESPLSFPVEAPKPAGVEPGAGEPLSFPAEAGATAADPLAFPTSASPSAEQLVFPAAAAGAPAGPLAFPSPAPSADPLAFPTAADPLDFPVAASAPADPLAFPTPASFPAQATQATHPAEQLPFPVAELPGAVTPPPPAGPAPIPATEASAPAPTGFLRFLPPVVTAVAALMTAGGCFLPLFRVQQAVNVRQRFLEAQLTFTQTAWGSRIEVPGQEASEQASSPVGIPVILAVIVLVAAAFTALSRPDRGLGRWLIAAGALFTAGVVTTVGMSGLGWSVLADGLDVEVVVAAGMWLLIGGTVLAAVAAVLAYLPAWRRTGDWADPALAYADTPTPPTGVAITVLPPEEPG